MKAKLAYSFLFTLCILALCDLISPLGMMAYLATGNAIENALHALGYHDVTKLSYVAAPIIVFCITFAVVYTVVHFAVSRSEQAKAGPS